MRHSKSDTLSTEYLQYIAFTLCNTAHFHSYRLCKEGFKTFKDYLVLVHANV